MKVFIGVICIYLYLRVRSLSFLTIFFSWFKPHLCTICVETHHIWAYIYLLSITTEAFWCWIQFDASSHLNVSIVICVRTIVHWEMFFLLFGKEGYNILHILYDFMWLTVCEIQSILSSRFYSNLRIISGVQFRSWGLIINCMERKLHLSI